MSTSPHTFSPDLAEQEVPYHDELPDNDDQQELPAPASLSHSISSTAPITRTVAIIKNHALIHRFDIEPRIQEASFEIVKERQMEFDTETDPETLYELFGEDTHSLAEGPVWVYVLERRRAVEVWNTLMGDRDPEIARRETPNSLRALYGINFEQNALMGSPDSETAEIQIASLFASSPPFPSVELPDDHYGTMGSVSESVLSALRKTTSDEGYAPSNATNPSTLNGSSGKLNANGKPGFRARPAPSAKPTIVPRMSRAASLRAGIAIDKAPATPRAPVTKERLAQTFANVPGHKRSGTISVASTAAPTIAPRMTRAASLRLGQEPVAPQIKKRSLTNEENPKSTFEGVPGHKRRESIAVASSKAPTVAPRLNKSAALRQQQKDQAPPTSFMFRAGSAPKVPGLSRTTSQDSIGSSSKPSKPPRPSTAPQASVKAPTPASRYAVSMSRSSSAAGVRPRPSLAPKASSATNGVSPAEPKPKPRPSSAAPGGAPAKSKPRPSMAAAPSIAPRTNRSAALRAAKQEAENAAAAAAAAKKGPRPSKAPPSSFKAALAT
ncbi:hypothetical protein BDQ12DRAFT_680037 [Crucibulum laeve]|uniref:Nucleoside diphosphate kinase n=1 Tax=Crucibulum laeve TaxID=68775 RepID=A0A5C3M7Y2_9AGAR|nr:hypothetical protein BDQ12DRAFT_680037 [Crucibulum laeve]